MWPSECLSRIWSLISTGHLARLSVSFTRTLPFMLADFSLRRVGWQEENMASGDSVGLIGSANGVSEKLVRSCNPLLSLCEPQRSSP
jgi:hypothetical protein